MDARLFVAGCAVLAGMTGGCSETVWYGDASIIKKKNLHGAMTYSLNSPSLSLGAKRTFVFKFRDLPQPGCPSWLIVSPHREETPPPFLDCSLDVSFEDLDGTTFFSTILELSSIESNSHGYWPHSIRLYDGGEAPELKTSYNIRVKVLTPSKRRSDKAYLHSFSLNEKTLY